MRYTLPLLSLTLLTRAAFASEVDLKNGKELHEMHCNSCHQSMFNGSAEEIYTRNDRKMANYSMLQNQVQRCVLNLRLKWFEDELNNVSQYLNQTYYQFPIETSQ